jgi:hypothetical protein
MKEAVKDGVHCFTALFVRSGTAAQAEGILEEMNYRVRHARRLPLCGNER